MGKIKSAVITAFLVVAVFVLSFFALFSWQVPGSNGVDRYNSFLSSISLGGGLTGEAYALLYPEGVITSSDYEFAKPEDEEKLKEYVDKYENCGNVYIEKDALQDGVEAFKKSVQNDATILAKRYAQKGYTQYSVSVVDDFLLKVAVPTNFTYSAFRQLDMSARSKVTSDISRTVKVLAYDGELTLRNSEVGTKMYDDILTPVKANIGDYFKSITKYSMGGNHAVKINLTKSGKEQFTEISQRIVDKASEEKAIGFYIGENQLLSLKCEEVIKDSSFFISVDAEYAQDYAIVLSTAINGETIDLNYSTTNPQIVYASSALGNLSAPLFGGALLLAVLGFVLFFVLRYKKLGAITAFVVWVYTIALITAVYLLAIKVTMLSGLIFIFGLTLLCMSNVVLFEGVRKETKLGRRVEASVKSVYKKLLASQLETHIILIAVSILLTFVAVGELALCGQVLFLSTVASYILIWFTRFMWYVISSPAKNKFAFCGFKREEQKNG